MAIGVEQIIEEGEQIEREEEGNRPFDDCARVLMG